MKLLGILAIVLGSALSLVGCSAPGSDSAIVKCFDKLTSAGSVPEAKDVKLDLQVNAEQAGYVVSGTAYAATYSGTVSPLRITCHVGSDGAVKSATAELAAS